MAMGLHLIASYVKSISSLNKIGELVVFLLLLGKTLGRNIPSGLKLPKPQRSLNLVLKISICLYWFMKLSFVTKAV